MRQVLLSMLCLCLAACGGVDAANGADEEAAMVDAGGELIVVAAPRSGDPYYADQADAIFDFHIAYAKAVEGKDDFLVLTDAETYPRYAKALGEARVAIAPQEDKIGRAHV